MAWAVVAGATIATVGGAMLADDNGAGAANDAAADANRVQAQIARDQWNRYKEIYAPLEDSMVKDAQNYDTPEQYAKAAGDASATVSSQFSKARERLTRTPGLDPSSGAYQSSLVGLDLAQAANDATQQNAARQKVKDVAYARKTDALSLGKGLPAQASSALASSAGNSLAQAQFAQGQANREAGALGDVIGRGFSSWMNNKTPTSPAAVTPTNNSVWDGNAQGF